MFDQSKLRNIAIIAHVDHGKTTLVDGFLKQSHLFRDNQEEMNVEQILDSGELEREKGITISAKNISIRYKDYKINIIDTPGHSDFGGEVERTLNMADGCLLVVDAQEGPMPQTEYVLKKALELNLKVIVVINKIDKKYANVSKVEDKLTDLFLKLASNEEQLDFPIFYAIAKTGEVYESMSDWENSKNDNKNDLHLLLEKIVEYIPCPTGDIDKPFQMQINNLDYDTHKGRYLIGRIHRGAVSTNDSIAIVSGKSGDDSKKYGRVKNVLVREGLNFVEVETGYAGDIVAVTGIDSNDIGATICDVNNIEALERLKIAPPTVKIKFEANTSPFLGKEGKFVTATQLEERLKKEQEQNISLVIEKGDGGGYFVSGRGELQLSILIETLRREGYEFQVRKPEVVLQKINGVDCEPLEELFIDTDEIYIGTISEELNSRKATLTHMETENGKTRMVYEILTRNLFGLRNALLTSTKGNVVLNSYIKDYVEYKNIDEIYRKGVLISSDTGESIGYALNTVQERGELFIGPGVKVYEGMIVGINKYDNDMEVNVTKGRQKSAVRMKHDEITQTVLRPIKELTLEFALVFLGKDEMLEVTPKNLRLRKIYLTKTERIWSKRENLTDYAKRQMGL